MKVHWYRSVKLLTGSFIMPNFPTIIALILLASTPVFLLHNNYEIANKSAGYAFYLLIASIIWKGIQYSIKLFIPKDKIPSTSSGTKS